MTPQCLAGECAHVVGIDQLGLVDAPSTRDAPPLRVDRTFAFLDLCGFTRFTQAHGDDAAVAILADLRSVLRAISERRGVRITKWLGDGAMLSGVDPLTVISCASDARDRVAESGPLPLRCGIARGQVIMFEGDDYVGAEVNLAARLCAVAAPNTLLTTDRMVRDTPDLSRLARSVGALEIQGMAAPVHAVELRGAPERVTPWVGR